MSSDPGSASPSSVTVELFEPAVWLTESTLTLPPESSVNEKSPFARSPDWPVFDQIGSLNVTATSSPALALVAALVITAAALSVRLRAPLPLATASVPAESPDTVPLPLGSYSTVDVVPVPTPVVSASADAERSTVAPETPCLPVIDSPDRSFAVTVQSPLL